MTVAELITKLQALPPEAECRSYEDTANGWVEIVNISHHRIDRCDIVYLETEHNTSD